MVLADEKTVEMFLARLLYDEIGRPGTWSEDGREFSFKLRDEYGQGDCSNTRGIPYRLPDQLTLKHKPDIVIERGEEKISIEVKFKSSVTDQFKTRSFDMIHLKKSNQNLFGIMVYVKSGTGISPKRAKSICYAHDFFFSIPEARAESVSEWQLLMGVIKRRLVKA